MQSSISLEIKQIRFKLNQYIKLHNPPPPPHLPANSRRGEERHITLQGSGSWTINKEDTTKQ